MVHVEPLTGYRLYLRLDDGSERIASVERALHGEMFAPLRDDAAFREVSLDRELGTVVWPGGADLDPDVLHGDQQAEGDDIVVFSVEAMAPHASP